jgi:hypothetical protein
MEQEQTQGLKPVICIDRKKERIRIHRQTLNLMGRPEYIQLLVNPDKGMFALRGSFKGDHLAHRIRKSFFTSDNCYEIYSKHLMQALVRVNGGLLEDQSYRIYGEMIPMAGIARFDLNDLVLLGEESE